MLTIVKPEKQPPYGNIYNVVNKTTSDVIDFVFVGRHGWLRPAADVLHYSLNPRAFLCAPKKFKSKADAERFIKMINDEMGVSDE